MFCSVVGYWYVLQCSRKSHFMCQCRLVDFVFWVVLYRNSHFWICKLKPFAGHYTGSTVRYKRNNCLIFDILPYVVMIYYFLRVVLFLYVDGFRYMVCMSGRYRLYLIYKGTSCISAMKSLGLSEHWLIRNTVQLFYPAWFICIQQS